jgi:hypothetical protein
MATFDDERVRVNHAQHDAATTASGPESAPASRERRLLQLQRQAGNAGVAQLLDDGNEGSAIERLVDAGGQPLEKDTRAHMESAFGASFADVRVHTGPEATASAQRLGAHAYTVGSDVVFSEGHYDPTSASGQRTLAHELTHVVQQRSGPVDGTDTGSGVKVSDPSDRFERAAEATADRVMSGLPAAAGATGASAVQREEADEMEETAQGMWVQREEDDHDEIAEG